jgi:hypothetical protein
MPIIHFRCHKCNSLLEMDAAFSGRPVRCLACQQVTICHDEPEAETLVGVELVTRPAKNAPATELFDFRESMETSNEDEYRPRKQKRRDDDDEEDSRFRCPFCRTTARPIVRQQVSTGGWVLLVVLLICCLPLFWVGLFVKEDFRACGRCGIKLG